jgi:NDP-sugar pyrophosphorylase family protein
MTTMPPVALLAGGLATRLRPLTDQVPKAMVEVAGEPFIAHQLRLLRRERVPRVVLCVSYLAEQIEAFVGNGSRFGIPVVYRADGAKLLGTGGALRKALPDLGHEFMVMYGDSWLDTSFAPIVETFRASRMPALMTVFRNNDLWDRSNVRYENGRLIQYSKGHRDPQMQHIDWGLSVVTSGLFANQAEDTAFELAGIFEQLSGQGQLAGCEVTTRFYEIGSPAGLRETDALLRRQAQSLKPAARPSS